MKNRAFDYSKYQDWREPGELIPYAKNAKEHTEKQVRNIANSIRRFGWQQDCAVTEDNVLVIGHGRRLAAMKLGCKIPVHVIDKTADELTEKDIRELRIADNQTNAETGFDFTLLQEDLDGLDFDGFDFDFSLPEVPEEASFITEDEYDKPLPEEPKSQAGDIYRLGRHRLMCGDSTDINAVETLMDGEKADLLVTDPPYNVDYEGGTSDQLKIENDNMSDGAFREFLQSAFFCCDSVMKPGAAFYIWHADSEGYNFRTACKEIGWTVRQCLIWNKNSLVMGRQDYQWKHEPCLYGWKDGAAHTWNSDRKQTTVIDFERPKRNDIHPTMKPIGLFDYLIHNSSRKGELVLDTFGGSGTCIMACEQDGRRCFTMELDPRYVDAIIDRWETFTGEKAELLHREEANPA